MFKICDNTCDLLLYNTRAERFEEFVRNLRGNEVDDFPCYAFPRKVPLPIL